MKMDAKNLSGKDSVNQVPLWFVGFGIVEVVVACGAVYT